MDLTPDLLLEAKFAPARRGYDMNEVDDFLERCAEGLDVLLARLRAEFERAERAEAELAEVRAGGAPAAAPVEPMAPFAPEPTPPPAREPDPVRAEEPMRILIAAERTAEAAIADARAEAEAEARRAGDEARRSIESEVLALREDRDVLSADVGNLRRWLDEHRARVRAAALDLQRIADDPGALGDVAAPDLGATTSAAAEDEAPADEVADDHVEDEPTDAHDAVEPADDDDVQVVDARTHDDLHAVGFDTDAGEPTQAVPPFQAPGALFDDERAPTAFTGTDLR